MNILHVIANLAPRYGGPAKACFEMARAVAGLGHGVSIYTTNQDGPVELDVPINQPVLKDGVEIRYFPVQHPRFWGFSIPLAMALRKAIREYDIIHIHSLEVRVPLIDYRSVELMLSIPGRLKMNGSGPKHLLWKSLRQPLQGSIIHRPKQGFTLPFERWLRRQLYSEVKEVIFSPPDKIAEFINQNEVEQVWKDFNIGRTSWHRVWILYVLKKWVEQHI